MRDDKSWSFRLGSCVFGCLAVQRSPEIWHCGEFSPDILEPVRFWSILGQSPSNFAPPSPRRLQESLMFVRVFSSEEVHF